MEPIAEGDFRRLVDSHPRAIMLASDESRIIYVNRTFQRITGYDCHEVLGERPSLLSSGLHSTEFYQGMWAGITEHGRWQGLVWNRRKNGDLYPQWLTIFRVRGERNRFFAGIFTDVSELTDFDGQLASLAYYDPLTQLPNRSLFSEFLSARIGRAGDNKPPFAVLFLGVDFFKEINDLHGHGVGDKVLRQVARRALGVLRRDDVVARLSGDEFAAIVELDGDGNTVNQIGERMVRAFREPIRVDGREHFLSVSVGAAVCPGDGNCCDQLLHQADKAMHSAKLAGGGCFRRFDSALSQVMLRNQQLLEALTIALKGGRDEFYAHYQPQFALASGRVTGLEALLRWRSPEFGEVSPAEFIPLAENRGLINELTGRLVRCILVDLDDVEPGVTPGLHFAINISARQVVDDRLNELLAPLMARLEALTWVPELEITETNLMNLSSRCLESLNRLREGGARLAIDDFGTGYSSLAYLHSLPVHALKIDRQFIASLDQDEPETKVVAAILAIAEALNLDVVAEGIESVRQRDVLRELGCCCGQGYLLARPEPWSIISAELLDLHQEQGEISSC